MDMSKIKKFLGVANIGCNMILQYVDKRGIHICTVEYL